MNWSGWTLSLLGSVSVLAGAVWTCEQHLRREQEHIQTLYGFADALEAMERVLRLSAPPMEEVLQAAVSSSRGTVSHLLCRLSVKTLEYESLSVQWKHMASDNALQLAPEEIRLLERPGTVLGRCGVAEQCNCLRESVLELRRCARRREEALSGHRRLWYTLSLSAALLVVVMLI